MSWIQQQKGWLNCSKCPLHESRDKVVLGRGNLNAKIMFIGEGPGPQEDKTGIPFCGPSGGMLDEIFNVFDINRSDVFLDNAVACFPHIQEDGRKQIRKPSQEEISACRDRLNISIYTVDPTIIVTLGASALQGLTGETSGIVSVAGEVYETSIPGWYCNIEYPVYAMFHPSYLLRQTPPDPNEKKPNEKHPVRRTYKHFEDLLETIGMLSEAYYGVDIV
jgi:uracil-DNA glycosylase family 4